MSLVAVKLLVIRITGHRDSLWRAFLAIPEELAYIALGLIVAGISGTLPAFDKYYEAYSKHPHLNVCLLAAGGVLVCLLIHLNSRWVEYSFQGWKVADDFLNNSISAQDAKKALDLSIGKPDFARVYYLKFAFFLIGMVAETLVAGAWLIYIADIIQHYSTTP